MSKYAVVVIGYNRIESMLRTLESAKAADYCSDNVDLIISLDNSGNPAVKEAADSFVWPYGNKTVRLMPQRVGLKNHILSCGDFLENYEAIAVLEDDIIVAPGFYAYMKSAVTQYENDDRIAGISLYGFEWNPNYNGPFYPQKTMYDTYFIQYAQSWGQIWMKESFGRFKTWYELNKDCYEKPYDGTVPPAVYSWPVSSWLKFHIKYCVDNNKYFVFPYNSYSTNFTERGEHYVDELTRFQVSLQHDVIKEYKFPSPDEGVRYDAYFENEDVYKYIGASKDDVVIDIYGNKQIPQNKKYFLSSQILNYEIKMSYGLSMRPQEDNIMQNTSGTNVFLYDLSYKKVNPKKKKEQISEKWNYYNHEKFVMMDEAFPVAAPKFRNLIKVIFGRKK